MIRHFIYRRRVARHLAVQLARADAGLARRRVADTLALVA